MDNNKDLDNIVIISIYDSPYNYSIMENGAITKKFDEHRNENLENALDVIYDNSKLREIFPNKTIIVCEDGDIEVIK